MPEKSIEPEQRELNPEFCKSIGKLKEKDSALIF